MATKPNARGVLGFENIYLTCGNFKENEEKIKSVEERYSVEDL